MDKKQKRSLTRGIILVLLVAAIAYTVYATATKDKVKLLKEGAQAPDFELVDLNGNTHRLSDYKGQGVLLNFWGTWCEPCKREMPAMERQYTAYKNQGIQVIAVNIAQSDFEVRKYVKNLGVTFPVAIDKTKSVMTAYNVKPLPTTVFINPEGKVQKIIFGEMEETKIATLMESIKPN